VSLVGTYISAVEDGDIAKRDQLRLADIVLTPEELNASDHTVRLAKRASAVMKGYIARFEGLSRKSRGKGEAERLILSIVGLFNRPAEGAAVRALMEGTPIPGLTDVLAGWSPQEKAQRLRIAKLRLRELKLLAEADPSDADGLDAHPVVRAHFERDLLGGNARGYHAAQQVLAKYYADLASGTPHFDVSRDERMDARRIHLLAMAIYHKCRTGQAEDAFVNLYWRQIQAERRYYLTTERHLGAYALSILANLFAVPWRQVRPVGDVIAVRILNEAGFCLRGVGRLDEAAQAYDTAVHLAERIGRFMEYFRSGVNLANVHVILGDLEKAAALARTLESTYKQLKGYWDNAAVEVNVLATLADILYQLGDTNKAVSTIRKATQIAEAQSPPLMTIANRVSLQMYAGGGNLSEGVARARGYLDRLQHERKDDLAAIALCELLLALGLGRTGSTGEAATLLDNSVLKLRGSAREDMLPYGLLARAAFRRRMFEHEGDPAMAKAAGEDLAEVEEIARRGRMKLHLADFNLECARLHLAQIARGEPVWLPPQPGDAAPTGKPGGRGGLLAQLFGRRRGASPAADAAPGSLTAGQQQGFRAAEAHLREGTALIEETHYHRRNPERVELDERIAAVAVRARA
jgi:tetratricopeptide (TPR) repeat protein